VLKAQEAFFDLARIKAEKTYNNVDAVDSLFVLYGDLTLRQIKARCQPERLAFGSKLLKNQ